MPRTPLIPGITDTGKNIRDIIDFYIRHDIDRAALLPNNPMWFDKLHEDQKKRIAFQKVIRSINFTT